MWYYWGDNECNSHFPMRKKDGGSCSSSRCWQPVKAELRPRTAPGHALSCLPSLLWWRCSPGASRSPHLPLGSLLSLRRGLTRVALPDGTGAHTHSMAAEPSWPQTVTALPVTLTCTWALCFAVLSRFLGRDRLRGKQAAVRRESCQALAGPADLLHPDSGQHGSQILPVNPHALGLGGRMLWRQQARAAGRDRRSSSQHRFSQTHSPSDSPSGHSLLTFSEKAAVTAETVVSAVRWIPTLALPLLAAWPEIGSLGLKTQCMEKRLNDPPPGLL